jgi:DNA topoisomerase VI subunit A
LIAAAGVQLRLSGDRSVVALSGSSPKEITDDLSAACVLDSEAEFILVVEKEASFTAIVSRGFVTSWPCILVTVGAP